MKQIGRLTDDNSDTLNLESSSIVEGINTGYNRREYGSGTDALRMFFAAVDFLDTPSTSIKLLDEFLISKTSEINELRKIFY